MNLISSPRRGRTASRRPRGMRNGTSRPGPPSAGNGGVATDVGRGEQLENRWDIAGFEIGDQLPDVGPHAVVPAAWRQPVRDVARRDVIDRPDQRTRRTHGGSYSKDTHPKLRGSAAGNQIPIPVGPGAASLGQPQPHVVPDGAADQACRRHHVEAVEQAEPAQKPFGQNGIRLGGAEELVEQAARPAGTTTASARWRCAASGRRSRSSSRPAMSSSRSPSAEVARDCRRPGVCKHAPQMARLQRRHRHALAEGRVEAHHGVAERDDAAGKRVELVVAAPPAGRVFVKRHLAERLALAQRCGDMRGQDLVGQRRTSPRSPAAARPWPTPNVVTPQLPSS